MASNIIALLFCCLMLWLLQRYAVPQIRAVSLRRVVLAFHGFLILVLVLNALFAFLGRGGLLRATELPATHTLQELERAGSGDSVILVGRISPENGTLYREYAVYVEDYLHTPTPLWIELEDGSAAITNNTYAQRNWPLGPDTSATITYLQASYPVVVTGSVERATAVAGASMGSATVRADLVYSGDYVDFVEQARQRMVVPTVLLALNLVAALAGVVLAARAWHRIGKQIAAGGES